jgi:hypothetical protein
MLRSDQVLTRQGRSGVLRATGCGLRANDRTATLAVPRKGMPRYDGRGLRESQARPINRYRYRGPGRSVSTSAKDPPGPCRNSALGVDFETCA